ncbi:hypothetical protein [Bradyrhizobium sp. STM 3557]|uniref:hypothetical protein n=1 Tax=Bradyrhizobium sp. STM 3557 TaxID=578920 RepID=UPI00388F194E
MSWREERDALIAQTLAFVQSVTGKPTDFSQLAPASAVASAVPPVPELSAEIAAAPSPHNAEPEASAAGVAESLTPPATGTTAPDQPEAAPPESITGHPFTSIASQLGLQRDMQAEIRARIASFRANQERFNRERQEYFSSTLERLRASMNDVRNPGK